MDSAQTLLISVDMSGLARYRTSIDVRHLAKPDISTKVHHEDTPVEPRCCVLLILVASVLYVNCRVNHRKVDRNPHKTEEITWSKNT